MTRRELRIVAVLIGTATLFTIAVGVWRIAFDDAWSPWPWEESHCCFPWYTMLFLNSGWRAALCAYGALVVLLLILRKFAALPNVTAAFFATASGIGVAGVLAILASFPHPNFDIDRVQGPIAGVNPWTTTTLLVATSALLIAIGATLARSLRHVPPLFASTMHRMAIVLIGIFVSSFWLIGVLPFIRGWRTNNPEDFSRTRPLNSRMLCRGATVFVIFHHHQDFPDSLLDLGTIDSTWPHFSDRTGHPHLAVSYKSTDKNMFVWITDDHFQDYRVHLDDAAIKHCQEVVKPERVIPARWHIVNGEAPKDSR